MEGPPSRRVVIVGAGITGSLTALTLRRLGWEVVVVEAEYVGAGSSSRTAAGIRQQFSTRETVVGMRYSVATYRAWREFTGGDRVPIHQNGYLFLHDRAEAWEAAKARVVAQRGWGLTEVEALAGPELARFPFVDPERVLGATWGPTDGFMSPEAIYNDAMMAFRAEGGVLHTRSPVLGARHAGGRLVAVRTPRGELEADLFVDATNAWSQRVGRVLGARALPVCAVKRYLWFLAAAGELSGRALLDMPLTILPNGVYCRPENAGSLMVGWAHDAPDEAARFTWEDQDVVEPAFSHKSGTDTRPYEAWASLAEVLPPVAAFEGLTATTSGYYGTTPDHNPFLGYDPDVPNLLRLVGFSGHGAMFGPFTARVAGALAEAGGPLGAVEVLGERVSLDPFRLDREFADHEAMVI